VFSEDALSIADGNRQVFVPTGFYRVSGPCNTHVVVEN
jgi:hypothetical protein